MPATLEFLLHASGLFFVSVSAKIRRELSDRRGEQRPPRRRLPPEVEAVGFRGQPAMIEPPARQDGDKRRQPEQITNRKAKTHNR
jgi:hypothetical protein